MVHYEASAGTTRKWYTLKSRKRTAGPLDSGLLYADYEKPPILMSERY
jgi:hypothetical protein